jgi:biotin carboxylase
VFLQPANVSASMWATRNEDEAGLLHNYRTILREVPAYYERLGKRGQSLSIAVAEYLEGANVSVDCVIDRYGRVHTTPAVFVLTGKDIGINDYHHFARVLPSRLSPAQEEELLELSINGCEALDMHSAAAHVEFIGKRLGEIAARPGGNRPRILELAYGMDLLYAFYQALAGETPRLTRVSRNAAAIISPYPARAGTLRAINHLAELPQLPGYLYHEIRAQPGTAVGTASGGFRAPLYVELRSPDENEVRRGLDQLIAWSDIYVVE